MAPPESLAAKNAIWLQISGFAEGRDFRCHLHHTQCSHPYQTFLSGTTQKTCTNGTFPIPKVVGRIFPRSGKQEVKSEATICHFVGIKQSIFQQLIEKYCGNACINSLYSF